MPSSSLTGKLGMGDWAICMTALVHSGLVLAIKGLTLSPRNELGNGAGNDGGNPRAPKSGTLN